ncbi:MAG: Rdx family protein [Planctomycetes bacterium]|nr:SelT/SelW/SelH family protein [Planctomycetota bacterium]MCC6406482.1 Rdx family protein [Planctomycetota bacterium]
MKVTIEYCGGCPFLAQANALAVELKDTFGEVEVELVRSTGGAFEVRVDGNLVFSKKASKRFPAYREIPELIGA